MRFILISLTLAASTAFAQVPTRQSVIAVHPSYINFCPASTTANSEISRGAAPGRELRIITVHNAGAAPLIVEKSILLQKHKRPQTLPGIVTPATDAEQPPLAQAIEARDKLDVARRSTGFGGFTNCADSLGNPLPVAPGHSCSVFVRQDAPPHPNDYSVAIQTNDPATPVVTVPVIVSNSVCGTTPSSAYARIGQLVGPGPFVPVRSDEVAPSTATIYNHWSCQISCRNPDGITTGPPRTVHVAYYSTNTGCCSLYFNTVCKFGGSVSGAFLYSE